jgi:hypothetical protein
MGALTEMPENVYDKIIDTEYGNDVSIAVHDPFVQVEYNNRQKGMISTTKHNITKEMTKETNEMIYNQTCLQALLYISITYYQHRCFHYTVVYHP